MKCFNRCCIFCVLLLMSSSLCLTSFATESVDSLDNYSFAPVRNYRKETSLDFDDLEYYLFAKYDDENPLPVMVIEEDPDYVSIRNRLRAAPILVIGDEPPDSPLFYGSGWVTGTDANLGTVTIYFPINYKAGYLGVDANGYLFNVSSTSLSGYLSGVYNNSLSAPAFSYPRYRESNSSSYITLYLKPENSNMEIATTMAPKYAAGELVPYISLFIGGVLILCFMKRS